LESLVNRRTLLKSALLALSARGLPLPAWITPALAQTAAATEPAWRHGASEFGDLKYPAGFKQFEFVNAQAPKGGTVRQIALGTFDNFNPVIADVKGRIAALSNTILYNTLATSSLDEVSSEYGLLADALRFPADFAWVAYRLRPEAKWHDGTPVTPEDVIFSFDVWKKNSPSQMAYYRHVTKAEKTGEHEVTFTFDGPGNRELPQIVGQLTVLSKAWWEGTDKDGKKRDVTQTTL
jgi:microcin C transport system substrate-binding protein